MRHRGQSRERAAARALWSRWVVIVELFANRRDARYRVDPKSYALLYQDLLLRCRSLAEQGIAEESDFFRSLETMIRPWIDPNALAKADREILLKLLDQCRLVERRFGGSLWLFWRTLPVASVFLVSTALATMLFLHWTANDLRILSLDRVQGWTDIAWFTLRRSSDNQRLIVGGLAVILVSIRVVSQTARS